VVKDDVNFVNAIILAKERGIRVTETTHSESKDYLNLITVSTISSEATNTVAGTLFGKKEPRVVKIDNFRVEMVPQGHLVLINNIDKPGAIGSIGMTLGENDINIDLMQVGQDKEGERNIIFLRTDIPIPNDVLEKLHALPFVKSVRSFEL